MKTKNGYYTQNRKKDFAEMRKNGSQNTVKAKGIGGSRRSTWRFFVNEYGNGGREEW